MKKERAIIWGNVKLAKTPYNFVFNVSAMKMILGHHYKTLNSQDDTLYY